MRYRRVDIRGATQSRMAARGGLSFMGAVLQSTTRFASNWVIGRLGGPAVLGTVTSVTSLALTMVILWPNSNGSAASKFIARARGRGDYREGAAVTWHLAKRTLQSTFGLGAIAVPLWMALAGAPLTEGLCVAALVVGYGCAAYARGVHFGAGQVRRLTGWDAVTSLVGAVAVLLVLLLGVRGVLVVLPLAAAQIIFALACWPWGSRGVPSTALRREIDMFVAIAALGSIASSGLLQISVIVCRIGAGPTAAGVYAAALSLATPLSLAPSAVSQVLYPSMAEAYGRGDDDSLRRQTDLFTRLLVLSLVPALSIFALMAHPLVQLVWGDRFGAASSVLPLMTLAILLSSIAVPSVNFLTSRSHKGMYYSLFASQAGLVLAILWWLLTNEAPTITTVAIGYLIGVSSSSLLILTAVRRVAHMNWTGLSVRASTAVLVAGMLMVSAQRLHWGSALYVLTSAVFVLLWIGCNLGGFRSVIDAYRAGGKRALPS